MNKKITNEDIIDGSFVVPESVAEIVDFAFEDCTSLSSIIIPKSVVKIGEGAFDGCESLKSIIIPDSVTKIGDYAFHVCSSLKKVSLPKKVDLGYSVFDRCHPDIEIVYRD